ncbi:hypothetical protein GA0070616_4391 [Micromonospora nigra]|uniref:Uncharacterized protein n=1 Tax=Micromonospora nigra TaxID=145857 RepID=A0A1C6SS01_9ACTN|nr:hypothetical protein [Micromonospora nigra]SCL32122.1 hypothetical protein GA0070616_4391 [Micromonospora nigra]
MSIDAPPRVRSPRTYTTSGVQRRERAAALPLPALGALAGTFEWHPFTPIAPVVGLPQCRHCFGFVDDVRHPVVARQPSPDLPKEEDQP